MIEDRRVLFISYVRELKQHQWTFSHRTPDAAQRPSAVMYQKDLMLNLSSVDLVCFTAEGEPVWSCGKLVGLWWWKKSSELRVVCISYAAAGGVSGE